MEINLNKQVAIVTGSSSGIGKGIAISLAKSGAITIVNHSSEHSRPEAEETLKTIEENGGEGLIIQCDVSKEDQVLAMFQATIDKYGTVDILYGSRSADDLVQLKEIQEVWMKAEGVNVYLTIDREQEGWDGHVGFVPTYLKEIGFDTDKVALVCGPPIMIKFVLAGLQEMGFTKEQVYTTLELRMKCGVGKCGRCNIGSKYVCKDGPVFRFDEIDELPNEY